MWENKHQQQVKWNLIVKLIDKTNKNNNIYFEINDELSDFNNDIVQYERPIQRVSESDNVGKTSTDGEQRQHTEKWRTVQLKSAISFRTINHQKIQKEKILQQELNREIFCRICRMLLSTRKISTTEISSSMFIC